jgi:hypothetical protein
MIWLVWRQHRLAMLAIAGVLAVIGAFLLLTGLPMYASFQAGGLAGCLGQTTGACGDAVTQFSDQYRGIGTGLIPWLNFFPGLLGLFVGAPLIAREVEQGTHRLIWTQAASRRSWLAVKLGLQLALTVAAAVAFTAMMTWWRWPLDQLEGHFATNVFDFEGPIATAYAVFAFALGTAAGAVLRRTVAAIGVTLAGFLAVRLPVEGLLRAHYQPALTTTVDATDFRSQGLVGGTDSWIVASGLQDSAGHRLGLDQVIALSRAARTAGQAFPNYLHDHGIVRWLDYQPADRLATFQAIETAIFLSLAALLIGLTVVWVRRRIA